MYSCTGIFDFYFFFLYSFQQDQIQSMGTEFENYKKSVLKEQEQNEQLTLLHKKIESDIGHIKKQIEQISVKIENLQTEYSTYTRALQETEQALTVASGVSGHALCVPICTVYVHVCIYVCSHVVSAFSTYSNTPSMCIL